MSSEFRPSADGSPFGSSSPTAPWVWVLIPVGIVVIIGGAAVFLHSQRKARMPHDPPPPLLPLSNNDALRAQRARRGRSRAFDERELSSHQSRWYAAGPVRPTEEGLNELGEAPPPYEKQLAPPPPPSPPAAAVVHARNLHSEPETDTGGAGPALEPTPHFPAGSVRGGVGSSDADMHEVDAVTTAMAMSTSRRSSMSSSSSVDSSMGSQGRAGHCLHPLSPFTMSRAASTAASSMPSLASAHTGPGAGVGTGATAGPPLYEGPVEPGHGQGGSGVGVPALAFLADAR